MSRHARPDPSVRRQTKKEKRPSVADAACAFGTGTATVMLVAPVTTSFVLVSIGLAGAKDLMSMAMGSVTCSF